MKYLHCKIKNEKLLTNEETRQNDFLPLRYSTTLVNEYPFPDGKKKIEEQVRMNKTPYYFIMWLKKSLNLSNITSIKTECANIFY